MNSRLNAKLEALKESMSGEGVASAAVEEMLGDAAVEFAKKHAKTSYIMGGPKVETRDGVSVLKGNLKPYNDAKIDSYIVVVEDDKVEMRVYGSFASDDVEAQGFGQTSAKKVMSLKGLDASKLAKALADLGQKAKA